MEIARVLPNAEQDDLYTGFEDLKIVATPLTRRTSAEGASRKGGRPDVPFTRAGLPTTGGMTLFSRHGRTSSGAVPPEDAARPLTAIRAVGYTSHGNRGFDPFNLSGKVHGKNAVLEDVEETPEAKVRLMERKINELVEESCLSASRKDAKTALEKAKEAAQKERVLVRQREQTGLTDQPNLDLTFVVLLNLASQYTLNELYSEALNTYQVLMRNRLFQNAGRLKVNMGNVYVKLGYFSKAIKLYRMALDQVPNTHKKMRIKIMQNIGILFVKMGKYNDAIASFEYIMSESPDFKTGLNLVLCYYALNNGEKMKKSFQKLVEIPFDGLDSDDDKHAASVDGPLREAIENDALHQVESRRRHEAEWSILMAAKLISPVIENNLNAAFAWCVDTVKSSSFSELSQEMEINKAVLFLKQRDLSSAVETLKAFERKKDAKVAGVAATNLAFLYLLEKDWAQADEYADAALAADHFNPAALVNKGCSVYSQGDHHRAQDYFREALANEATCTEALYNLGLSLKKVDRYEEALDCFTKLHAMLPNRPQVLYQLANTCEQLDDYDQSLEWNLQLLNLVPTDPGLLQKMGATFEAEGDKQQAFQYYYDSHRYFPSSTQVSTWLGAYYIESEVYEKAVAYFERAALMQPTEVKWQLMVASCHRRSGNYQKALNVYKAINRKFPDNVECLKFIVRLCSDMGLQEARQYTALLAKAEQAKTSSEQQGSGRKSGRSRHINTNNERVSAEGARSVTGNLVVGASTAVDNNHYADPLPAKSESRPRTSARDRSHGQDDQTFTDDEELEDLLP